MTYQIPDKIEYKNKVYSLNYTIPTEVDILVNQMRESCDDLWPSSSACWRGNVKYYTVISNELFLTDLCMKMQWPELIEIDNIIPSREGKPGKDSTLEERRAYDGSFDDVYSDIKIKTNYTGDIVIGEDFIESLNSITSMLMYTPTWMYEKVTKLSFKDGILINIEDVSDEYKEIREVENEKYKTSQDIDTLFGMDYEYTKDDLKKILELKKDKFSDFYVPNNKEKE